MSVLTYKLKGGEEIRGDGKLYGWTGNKCTVCDGTGETSNGVCCGCAGTGKHWGLMPTQPDNLPEMK
jgi:hypothetical protein